MPIVFILCKLLNHCPKDVAPIKTMSRPGGTMTGAVRIGVKRSACNGYGICAELCPEVFKLDQNGIVFIEDPLVPEELATSALEAVGACPQSALSAEPAGA